ncbi:hypothetical protein BDY19DRAFT_157379 [Irpex rosettiformis]|uniref:Uncharacterized protein n=1 Tax=Irpex rosettiformis TaxID=378272 RepID=A0ACB8U413_9APHY|nr:hypothetical protein BDY19DRAFT_157379 [Irpex rosettiformis]
MSQFIAAARSWARLITPLMFMCLSVTMHTVTGPEQHLYRLMVGSSSTCRVHDAYVDRRQEGTKVHLHSYRLIREAQIALPYCAATERPMRAGYAYLSKSRNWYGSNPRSCVELPGCMICLTIQQSHDQLLCLTNEAERLIVRSIQTLKPRTSLLPSWSAWKKINSHFLSSRFQRECVY